MKLKTLSLLISSSLLATSLSLNAIELEDLDISTKGQYQLGFKLDDKVLTLSEALKGFENKDYNPVSKDPLLPKEMVISNEEFNFKYASLTKEGIIDGWFGDYAKYSDEDILKLIGKAINPDFKLVVLDTKENKHYELKKETELDLGKPLSHSLFKYLDNIPSSSKLYPVATKVLAQIQTANESGGGSGGASGGASGGSGGDGSGSR